MAQPLKHFTVKYSAYICFLFVVTTLFIPTSISAMDAHFKSTYEREDISLPLQGVGVLKALGWIKIYNGALYLPETIEKEEILSNVPKRLEVIYLRDFKGSDFGRATLKGMKKSVDPMRLERLKPLIDFHNSLYEDVKKGDRMSLTYLPGVGTEVSINRRLKGTIPGDDFASALFSLWFGKKPFDRRFKKDLLGGDDGASR